ncbi:hypothetical protein [Fulvimarina endophytica]|nr:hypothetical protein [Fulvimarina endophytica]
MGHFNRRDLLVAAILAGTAGLLAPGSRTARAAGGGDDLTDLARLPMDKPDAPVIAIAGPSGPVRTVSREDLAGLEQTVLTTHMPWSPEVHHLEGPSLARFVSSFTQKDAADEISIEAIDGFIVTAPIAELVADGAVLVIRQDGDFLPVSAKGPAFVMFPFEERPEIADRSRFGRCIWQITRITIS